MVYRLIIETTWDVGRTLDENLQITRLRLMIYKFFSCSTNIPRGLSAFVI